MTNVNGTLVPAPGAAALMGVGGLVAMRRRRAR
jgi:MYXO-CTERM domain-containing protein